QHPSELIHRPRRRRRTPPIFLRQPRRQNPLVRRQRLSSKCPQTIRHRPRKHELTRPPRLRLGERLPGKCPQEDGGMTASGWSIGTFFAAVLLPLLLVACFRTEDTPISWFNVLLGP